MPRRRLDARRGVRLLEHGLDRLLQRGRIEAGLVRLGRGGLRPRRGGLRLCGGSLRLRRGGLRIVELLLDPLLHLAQLFVALRRLTLELFDLLLLRLQIALHLLELLDGRVLLASIGRVLAERAARQERQRERQGCQSLHLLSFTF